MITIGYGQSALMGNGMRSDFIDRMEVHFVKNFASVPNFHGEGVTDVKIRDYIERNWEQADHFGISTEYGVCSYLEAIWYLGEDFHERNRTLDSLLMGDEEEAEKIPILNEYVSLAKN